MTYIFYCPIHKNDVIGMPEFQIGVVDSFQASEETVHVLIYGLIPIYRRVVGKAKTSVWSNVGGKPG
jgi:hypothetical protein